MYMIQAKPGAEMKQAQMMKLNGICMYSKRLRISLMIIAFIDIGNLFRISSS